MATKPTPTELAQRQRPAKAPSDAALALAIIRSKSQDPAVRAARAKMLHPKSMLPEVSMAMRELLKNKK